MARTSTALLPIFPLLLTLGSCIAHAPQEVAGPDSILVAGDLPHFPVRIEEDRWGIPHIRARSEQDAFFALGVLHAEERLWQMELNRRAGLGRLSEIFGRRTLATDRFLRTVGFREAAESALAALPARELALLEAYAAGINSHIEGLKDLPPEYRILGFEPEPWEPLHSILWTKSMSWLLSASASTDALYDALRREHGEDVAGWLVPDYPDDGPRILPLDQMQDLRGAHNTVAPEPAAPEAETTGRLGQLHPALEQLDVLLGRGPDVGSNNWVVHGSRTNTDAPILSNDPHLGVQVPSIWYLAEIDCPTYHVVGATMPGIPGVVIGHNEHIAWGATNLGADVMDLVLERPDPEHEGSVLRPGGREALEEVQHSIRVKGRSKPVQLTVRRSSNGPLVSEFFPGYEDEVALRWTALEPGDRTLSAFLGIGRASNWEDFLDALRLFVVPSQNFVYADRKGHIGWKAPGLIPIRKGYDGRRPARGWTDEAWTGWVPFEELPEALDPIQGWIVSANNHPVSDDYPHDLGRRFAQPYRAKRIIDLLEQGEGRTPAGHQAMQLDTVSAQVAELLPLLLALRPEAPRDQAALELLRRWDGDHSIDSPAAALYNAWMIEVGRLLVADHFGKATQRRVHGLNGLFLREALTGEGQQLCVHEGSRSRRETRDCSDVAGIALEAAVQTLRKKLGKDMKRWSWGRLHELHYHHQLGVTPHLRERLDTRRPGPGGPHTVNIGSYPHSRPFTQTWFASYRQVIDLSDWSKSGWIHSPGQSGVPWRAHYRDLVDPYLQGELLPMAFGQEATRPFVVRTRQLRR